MNSQTELAKHFELLACPVPGMGRTELPAAAEYSPEGGKLQGDKKNWSFLKLLPSVYLLASLNLKTLTPQNLIYTQSNLISHTLKINKWLN